MAAVGSGQLSLSWYDSVWIPVLNQTNVMEYFTQKSNPFYDRTCNNEVIKMQRGDPAQLVCVHMYNYMCMYLCTCIPVI